MQITWCCVGSAIVIVAACATYVVVDPRLPELDSVTRPALFAYMWSTASPTIVVPAPQGQVAQAQQVDAATA